MGGLYTFHKSEILSHKKTIDAIFLKKGKSIFKPPLLFIFLETELNTSFPCQVLFSVSKRKFKKAVDRNEIKRQLREIYRLNKHKIYKAVPNDKKYALSILYLNKEKCEYSIIEKNLNLAIDEFIKRIS